jgi:ATP-dependent protease HslVU (ClpYQ) ATPase subunit
LFSAARRTGETVFIDAAFVEAKLAGIAGDDNLARYIL